MKSARLQYTKMAPQLVQACGLFRSVPPGTRKQRLEVTYESDDLLFRFIAPSQLGVDDMRVLLAITAIACAENPIFTLSPPDAEKEPAEKAKTLLSHTLDVRTTFDTLAREIGYSETSGGSHVTIRSAIERLFTVSVFIESSDSKKAHKTEAGHLFERLSRDDSKQLLAVKLCPLLAFAVLGGPGAYMRVDLAEARKLKTDIARLIHMRLSFVGPGRSGRARLDTLVAGVYGDDVVAQATSRQRRLRVKKALVELKDELGWFVQMNRDSYLFCRPRSRTRSQANNKP